jgi:hypothetical protein
MKKTNTLNRNFEVFAKGIERLQELKTELNSLNRTGFKKDVERIESQLKNVSAIPTIEKRLYDLKKKIRNKNKSKKTTQRIPEETLKNKIEHVLSKFEKESNNKFKRKEHLFMKEFKIHFKNQEDELKRKYEDLFKKRLANDLKKKVNSEFNNQVYESVSKIRKKLNEKTEKKNRLLRKNFDEKFASRKAEFDKKIEKKNEQIATIRKNFEEKFSTRNTEFENILNKKINEFDRKLLMEMEKARKYKEKFLNTGKNLRQKRKLLRYLKDREKAMERKTRYAYVKLENAEKKKTEQKALIEHLKKQTETKLEHQRKALQKEKSELAAKHEALKQQFKNMAGLLK